MKERTGSGISFLANSSQSSSEQIIEEINKLHEQKRKVNDMLSTVQSSVELKVNFNEPIRFIPISDMHLFTMQSDNKAAFEILNTLKEPHTYGFISGDFMEGFNPGIADHGGNVELALEHQVWVSKKIIEPFVATGKIICLVDVFNGHEGWGNRLMGFDIVQNMARDLKQPDGSPLKVVYNGGKLIVHLANGRTYTQLLYHAPGGGGSDEINPLGSQRARLWEFRKQGRIDGVGGGDWHHRAGVSKEETVDKRTGKEMGAILYATGTVKGGDPRYPDNFLTAMAKGPTLPPGVEITMHQRKKEGGNGEYVWASYGFEKGKILYDSAKIWDNTERQGITQELLKTINLRAGKPVAEFDRRNSRTGTKEDESKTPLFETFKWKITGTELPILVYLLANARYGSSSGERDRSKLLQILDQTAKDPYKYALIMRHFIDSEVPKDFDREETLAKMAEDLKGVYDANSLLGIMLSATLRSHSWTKDLVQTKHYWDRSERKHKTEKEIIEGFYPGDYLYKKSVVAKTPLYLNDALMLLNLGGIEYSFQILDHLARSGSSFDPFRGLVQARRKTVSPVDIVTGGHMPGAGFMTTPDANYVSTGWFSDYDSEGKANYKRAPLGGQGVILSPNKKMVIPVATFLEATDLHTALVLNAGLTAEEKAKLSSRTK